MYTELLYFSILEQMKIEVTFDRTTKQRFRDECVKRLQKFVHQIKERPEHISIERSHTLREHGEPETHLRENISSGKEGNNCGSSVKNSTDRRRVNSNKSSLQNSRRVNNDSVLASRLNIEELVCIQSQKESKQNSKCQEQFDIKQINESLNIIMLKLQKNSKVQQIQTLRLQNEVKQTNTRLDQLIAYLQQRNIIAVDPNSESPEIEEFIADKPSTFQQKFSQLANRYTEIKMNGVRPQRFMRNCKSIFSLEETGDSMTFRNN